MAVVYFLFNLVSCIPRVSTYPFIRPVHLRII